MPRAWYNIQVDLPHPLAPVLHPGTKQPITPDDLAPLFPMALIMQEVSTEVGAFFGIEIEVFMVKISYQQKPYRRSMMNTFGATIHASPTNLTDAGRSILEKDPENMGSLGIAISEAVEVAIWMFPGSSNFPFFMGAFVAGEVLASVPVPYSGWASAASF